MPVVTRGAMALKGPELGLDPDYVYLRCWGEARPINGPAVTQGDVDGTMLDVVPTLLSATWVTC